MAIEGAELTRRLRWLIRIRWIAVVALPAAGALLSRLARIDIATELYILLGFVALYNAYFAYRLKHLSSVGYGLVASQIFLDQISLAVAVYYSGSCESPFIYFFILHVITSGILLPPRYTAIFTAMGIVLPLIVFAATHSGLLKYHSIFRTEDSPQININSFLNYGAVYSATLIFAFYFTTYLSGQILKGKRILARSNKRLSSLIGIIESDLSETSLSKALSDMLEWQVKAKIIMLTEEPKSKCYSLRNCENQKCMARNTMSNCLSFWHVTCCGGKTTTVQDKLKRCSICPFMADILRENLKPHFGILENDKILKGLQTGIGILYGVQFFHETANLILVPLCTEKDDLTAVFAISSEESLILDADKEGIISAIARKLALELVKNKAFNEFRYSYESTVLALTNALEARDPYTKGHSERVAHIAIGIAEELSLGPHWKEHLRYAALLHDIGKVGVNSNILSKRCSLSECEIEEMKNHMELGVQILEPIPFLRPILPSIRHHHEKYDGTGYPLGLSADAIPLGARIISVADAWDAMLSNRPYRDALSFEEAISEIQKNSGTQFDPEIADALLRLVTRTHSIGLP